MSYFSFLDVLFNDILRVKMEYITGDFYTDFIFVIFLPMVFLITALYYITTVIVYRGHKGISILTSLAMLVFIIYSGWYNIMVVISKLYFPVIIIGGVIVFLGSHIVIKHRKQHDLKKPFRLARDIYEGRTGKYAPSERVLRRGFGEQKAIVREMEKTEEEIFDILEACGVDVKKDIMNIKIGVTSMHKNIDDPQFATYYKKYHTWHNKNITSSKYTKKKRKLNDLWKEMRDLKKKYDKLSFGK